MAAVGAAAVLAIDSAELVVELCLVQAVSAKRPAPKSNSRRFTYLDYGAVSPILAHMEDLALRSVVTPIGRIGLIGTASALTRVLFPAEFAELEEHADLKLPRLLPTDQSHPASALLAEAAEQFSGYFTGKRREFSLPLAPLGTPWQLQVWQGLRAIPYGQRWSYGQLAAHLGRPKAARAVGSANGRNPLPIVFPCHRVIAASGSLGGFSGGLDIKTWLLDLES